MTRYAFIGNCQVQALYHLYRKHVAPLPGDSFRYIRSYEDIAAADRAIIAAADIVVEQVQDFRPKGDIAGIETAGRRVFVPVVNAGFLWPYAGQPHPLNTGVWYLEGGPYGSEASDAFLNRMIHRKIPPDEAVARYRDTEINKTMSLDRLLELSLEKQRARDTMTGFAIAEIIEAHFRDEPIFRTPYHPNARVAKALATQFFTQMGVTQADTARMQAAMAITPFPKEELPLHPAVIRHFGLRYADSTTRYAFLAEGAYTFEDYAHRYMRYDWNAALQEGIALSPSGDIALALDRLRTGLALSPDSAQAHAALAHVLHRNGDHEAAISAYRHSLSLNPDKAAVHAGLAGVFNHLQQRDAAEAALRQAMALDPWEAHYPTLLAHWLRAWQRANEAASLARAAIATAPYTAAAHVELGYALNLADDAGQAEACFRQAIALAPDDTGARIALASLLTREARWDEAVAAWQIVTDRDPTNSHAQGHLVHALQKSGQLDAAIDQIETALAKTPRDVALLHRYATCLAQDERPTDAILVLRQAALIDPTNPLLFQDLAQLCRQTGDPAGTEVALSRLIELAPTAPDPVTQLAHLLAWQRRWPEAHAAATHALSLGGAPAVLHSLLAEIHQETGDHAAAATSLTQAAAAAPENGHLPYRLSKCLEKLGRLDDAVAAARAAVAIDPANPHWQTNLGHLLAAACDLPAAELALRAAVAASPASPGFHAALSDLLLRRGSPREAVAAAREAAALAPDNPHFQNRLDHMLAQAAATMPDIRSQVAKARALHLAGSSAAACDLLREVLAIAPQDGDACYTLSQALSALGQRDDALDFARQAVAAQPDNPHWHTHLGTVLMHACQLEEAEHHLREAVALAPQGAGFHDSLAQLLARQGQLDKAIAAVQSAVRLAPQDIHFRAHLARLRESAGHTEQDSP